MYAMCMEVSLLVSGPCVFLSGVLLNVYTTSAYACVNAAAYDDVVVIVVVAVAVVIVV